MTLGTTKIPYLDRLWHPTTGCSYGCRTCWARPLVINRLAGTMRGLPPAVTAGPEGDAEDGDPFAPTFHADRLDDPLRATRPQVIGVSFLGDLFDPSITNEQIAAVFGVMAACPQHTFVVLTKRAERMERWFGWVVTRNEGLRCGRAEGDPILRGLRPGDRICGTWPLPNVWLGVSVTCQADADKRIPALLRAPAAHRWVSAEPLVGAVDLRVSEEVDAIEADGRLVNPRPCVPFRLALVIAGGESGPKARPCHPDWARSLRDQCAAAGVPFNWKQWGEWAPDGTTHYYPHEGAAGALVPWTTSASTCRSEIGKVHYYAHGADGVARERLARVGTKAAGRLLDGQLHDDLPWRIARQALTTCAPVSTVSVKEDRC